MYHYPLKLTLKSGEVIEGVAQDTQRNDKRDECMKITTEAGEGLVELDGLKKLEAQVENPHLQLVEFG